VGEDNAREFSMVRSRARGPLAGALLAVVAIAATGCWNPFAPDKGGDGPPVVVAYKLRTSPVNVIYNMTQAYVYKNPTEYLACLAEDFTFHVSQQDIDDPDNPLPPDWDKPTERTIHEHMFASNSGVVSIKLNLTYDSDIYDPGEDLTDPMDDRWSYVYGTDLRVSVDDPPDLTYFANADQRFVFQIDPDEVGPDGETLWEVVDWFDLQESPGGRATTADDGDQAVSVSRLKSMYR
jgi:hypothetical protein